MADDRVFLNGMVFYGFHGVDPAEKSLGQRFIVDVELTTDLAAAIETDDLTQTINYSKIFKIVKPIVEGPSRDLLESVAGAIIRDLFAQTPATSARVRIRKPGVAIKGSILESAGIELLRHRPV